VTFLPSFKDIHPLRFPLVDRLHHSILDRLVHSKVETAEPIAPAIEAIVPAAPTPADILLDIGTQLRQKRLERNVSIEMLSLHTQIQPRIIEAIESGQIEKLPAYFYVKGSIQRYARAMALDGDALVAALPNWDKSIVESANHYIGDSPTRLEIPQQIAPKYLYVAYLLLTMALLSGISASINSNSRSSSHQQPNSAIVK
jgi:hypothetical protein